MSEEKISSFVLVIDPDTAASSDYRKFLLLLNNAEFISDWHSPFNGFVLLRSPSSIRKMGKVFAEFFDEGARFMLAAVNSESNIGLLPMETWDWMKSVDVGFEFQDEPET
jgi:hypothetical protein